MLYVYIVAATLDLLQSFNKKSVCMNINYKVFMVSKWDWEELSVFLVF
jgi:hypothetical protein